jgi:holo-[acyl-carrier protein] synthase
MIIGIGVDIIEVARVKKAFDRFGEKFLLKILCDSEKDYCFRHKNPMPFIAARFAAKEAVSKAFGTGIGAKLGWLDIEILKKDSGQPYVALHGRGKDLFEKSGASQIHISLSHTIDYVVATAVLEK